MNTSEIIIYQTEDGITQVNVVFDNDTVWLSLDQLAELFQRSKSTISRHLKNIYAEGELEQSSTVANFATVASNNKTYQIAYYNIDAIISVGYRVKSQRGVQFRLWTSQILKEYMKKWNENKINSLNSYEFALKLKELSEKMMKRNAEACRKLAYL